MNTRTAVLLGLLCSCTAPSEAPEERRPAALAEDLRIGAVDGGAEAFGRVMAVEADAAGNVYVADGLANEIRVFGPDGTHLRNIGRKGGGPGEFRMLTGMAWGPEGRLWTMDPVALRVSTLDTAGRFLDAYRREFSMALSLPWRGLVDEQGRVYDMTGVRAASGETRRVLVRYRPEGEQLVPLDTFPLPQTPVETVQRRVAPELTERVTLPFASGDHWRLAPDGSVWVGGGGTYRLASVTFDGDTVARLTHDRAPVPVTPAERDSAAAAAGVPADRIPPRKPAIRSFLVDDEGRVWVAPHAGDEGTTWDVFSPTGAFLATVHTPLAVEHVHPSPVVRAGALYGVIRDEMDVSYVVRLRVPPLR